MSDTNAEKDQRREERVSVNIPATLTLDNKLYTCVVLNMSSGGLLLRFDQQLGGPVISQDDTGKTGMVVLGTEGKPKRSLQGKIIRVFLSDNVRVAAIFVID
jgi:hypothetical protein